MSLKLIAGLGNPGDRYRNTRHNAGYMVLDALAGRAGIGWKRKRRLKSWLGRGAWRGRDIILQKPAVFVNLSGEPVRLALDYFGLSPGEALVVVDDVNLAPGRIRLRPGGGAGGHHGLESVAAALGGVEFPRLRVGVGGGDRRELSGYVLSAIGGREKLIFQDALERSLAAVEAILLEGMETAMNRFNRAEESLETNHKEEN